MSDAFKGKTAVVRIYLRSLNQEPALICADSTADAPATLVLFGPLKARQTLKTLLRLIFPNLKADSTALKQVCTQNPLFQYWFQVEAIREVAPAGSGSTAQPIWTRFRTAIGHPPVWQELFHRDPHQQLQDLEQLAGPLGSQDWKLAEQLLLEGLVPYAELRHTIQQTATDPTLSLAEALQSQGWIQPGTMAAAQQLDAQSRRYWATPHSASDRRLSPVRVDRPILPMVAIGDRRLEKLRAI